MACCGSYSWSSCLAVDKANFEMLSHRSDHVQRVHIGAADEGELASAYFRLTPSFRDIVSISIYIHSGI